MHSNYRMDHGNCRGRLDKHEYNAREWQNIWH